MGIDIWEIIEAAKSKPFGFMPFYPGPGLGGHCIPIDPFYLTWKAREHEIATRFIELAGEVNTRMPHVVLERLVEAVDRLGGRSFSNAKILVLGIAYKKNVDDIRESPSLKLIDLIEKRGAFANYHDPYVDTIPVTREHPTLAGRRSTPLTARLFLTRTPFLLRLITTVLTTAWSWKWRRSWLIPATPATALGWIIQRL